MANAIAAAERILRNIDERWPTGKGRSPDKAVILCLYVPPKRRGRISNASPHLPNVGRALRVWTWEATKTGYSKE